jgi:phosphatidylserine/phosphatidylglycerophosphate/cardiolipin synthase-like enzyme
LLQSEQPQQLNWWAAGDTPVHNDSLLNYFVDGRISMLTMCLHFLKARRYIYFANWGFTPTMELVRGSDHIAGPANSPEQVALLNTLRAQGLDEAALNFWQANDLTIQNVLGFAVSRGVEVRGLLWENLPIPKFSFYKPEEARQQLTDVGVSCLLDDSAKGVIHHPSESLHQKITVVDGEYAFVGGVDLMIEIDGDFDRWDSSTHLFSNHLRVNNPHPWHDVHSRITGPAAADVEHNFRQRWNDLVTRHNWEESLLIPEHQPAAPLQSSYLLQVARTIPEHTYHFEPNIVRGIAQFYDHALSNARQFIYLENQYFWLHAYTGVDIPFIETDSPEMEQNLRHISRALSEGALVAMVVPDHPTPGRAVTDAALQRLREEVPQAVKEGRLQPFCLGTSETRDGKEHYRPIYVHAKVAVIDDQWSTAGSGNLNNRGMRDDTEMNVAVLDRGLSYSLRIRLWAEHLGLLNEAEHFLLGRFLGSYRMLPQEEAQARALWQRIEQQLIDPLAGLRMLYERAIDNLNRYKSGQPLIGHILPYLTAEEAQQQGLNFREAHGWIEEEEHSHHTGR